MSICHWVYLQRDGYCQLFIKRCQCAWEAVREVRALRHWQWQITVISTGGIPRQGNRAFRRREPTWECRAWRRHTDRSCRRTQRENLEIPRDDSWKTQLPTHCRITCRTTLQTARQIIRETDQVTHLPCQQSYRLAVLPTTKTWKSSDHV